MTSIQPELWVENAVVIHRVGRDDIVAQLAVGTAQFWVTEACFRPLQQGRSGWRRATVTRMPSDVGPTGR